MKKIIYIAAAALVALASCTKNEVTREPAQISFKAVAGKNTKAALNTVVYPTDRPFGVFAYYLPLSASKAVQPWADYSSSASVYMNNVVCSNNGVTTAADKYYVPATEYYWPLEGSLTFVAYSPASGVNAAYTPGSKTLKVTDFTLGTTLADQVDLMYTKASDAKDLTGNGQNYTNPAYSVDTYGYGNNGVRLQFRHALSQVWFYAKTDKDYSGSTYFYIDKISLLTVGSKGTLELVNDAIATSSWNTSDPTNYVAYESTDGIELNTDYKRIEEGQNENDLLVIPQVATNDDDATTDVDEAMYIEVTYSMYVNGKKGATGAVSAGSKTVKVKVNNQLASFEPNKIYKLDLIISAEQIRFSPTIVSWEEEVEKVYNIPEDAV